MNDNGTIEDRQVTGYCFRNDYCLKRQILNKSSKAEGRFQGDINLKIPHYVINILFI